MADPVTPLIGFTFGCIGFLVTLRNILSLILEDHDNFKRFFYDLVPLLLRVSYLSSVIENWSSFWKIHDGCSRDLLTAYWGDEDGAKIWNLRTFIGLSCQHIQEEFKSKYKQIAHTTEARLREDGTANDSVRMSIVASEKRIAEHIQHWQKRVGFFQRLGISLFRRSLFDKHLDALERHLQILRKTANDQFAHKWKCDDSEVRKLAVDVWTHFTLSNLATTSAEDSEALLELLSTVTTFDVDYHFDLGYGIPTNQRADFLAERAARGAFPYCLEIYGRSTEKFAIPVIVETITPDEHREGCSNFERGILSWTDPTQDDILYMKPENHEAAFTIKNGQDWTHDLQALRSLFSSIKSEHFKQSLHGDFTMRDRIKLAYELAESAMVFLKTNWYCRLCSCRIQRACIDEGKYEYCLRMSDMRHLEPESGEMQTRQQWCEEELLDMHIQRLGILLVEIALGTTVTKAAYNPTTKTVEVDLRDDSGLAPDHAQGLSHANVAKRVEEAAGEKFSLAVDYCLRQRVKPEEVGPTHIEEFHKRVVAP